MIGTINVTYGQAKLMLKALEEYKEKWEEMTSTSADLIGLNQVYFQLREYVEEVERTAKNEFSR